MGKVCPSRSEVVEKGVWIVDSDGVSQMMRGIEDSCFISSTTAVLAVDDRCVEVGEPRKPEGSGLTGSVVKPTSTVVSSTCPRVGHSRVSLSVSELSNLLLDCSVILEVAKSVSSPLVVKLFLLWSFI